MCHTILRRCSFALAGLAAAALSACVSFSPQPGPDAQVPGSGNYQVLTTPIVALGDTQEHEPTGWPLYDNDSAVDAYVEVAQRPPEQPLFGRRIMEWALQAHPNENFLHLGDVLDLSCRSEAQRMSRVFNAAGRAGAILPGNHDGLMFGIYGYSIMDDILNRDAQKWNQACRRGASLEEKANKGQNEAFSKRDFIQMYLEGQAAVPSQPGIQLPPARGSHRVSWRNPNTEAFLSGIEAHVLDGYAYADSFLAQRIQLPRAPGATRNVIVIGLDTNQAGPLVSSWDTLMGRSPGSIGHVNLDQVRALTHWVTEAKQKGDLVIFAGHHNWRALGLPSRLLLRSLMSRVDHPLVYLSAHTHRGFWAAHRELDIRPVLELNVSSLSDWPVAYRRISFAYDEAAKRILVRGELMPHGEDPVESDDELMAAWEGQTCGSLNVPVDAIRAVDGELVRKQRESRGSLVGWLLKRFGPDCEGCDATLYEHAHAYQDAMLDAIMQVKQFVDADTRTLIRAEFPRWCKGASFDECVANLRAEQPKDYAEQVDLFRRKAKLVDLLGGHLDDLTEPRARAYMTCRAVQAAKLDFDATEETRNENRSEAKRRAERFFLTEASVGMD
ncbi:MAG: metallophosphoesterase [Burkholderiaceae bacterium]|nr:metallophosphoesterase [Burkholderiaceae bacterium]